MNNQPIIGWVISVAVTDLGLSTGPVTMAWQSRHHCLT